MIFNAVGGCVNPYPVGAIYLSAAATSPASLFGGTWERLKDRFLLGAGDTYAAGSTGGEAEVALTGEQNGPHSHEYSISKDTTPSGYGGGTVLSNNLYEYKQPTSSAGDGKPHNNMPPYLTVYMWKRVA